MPTRCVREGGKTIYYTYDLSDRLTRELWTTTDASPAQVYSFTYDYDTAGNRVKSKIEGTTFDGASYFFYNAGNALTVKGSNALYANPTYYHYDKNGSLTVLHETAATPGSSGPGATYFKYNPAMLVDRIDWKDGSRTQFFYDGNLQRERMIEHGAATYFLWNGPNILQEVQPSGQVLQEQTNALTPIAGIGQLVETNRPQEAAPADRKIYPAMDMRGTIHRWLKSDGTTVLASREYDAFGRVIASTGTWPSRFSYQGQAWYELKSQDGGQTLLLSPARIYLPEEGFFASRDPVDWLDRETTPFLGSWYGYTHHRPLTTIDPFGTSDLELASPLGGFAISRFAMTRDAQLPSLWLYEPITEYDSADDMNKACGRPHILKGGCCAPAIRHLAFNVNSVVKSGKAKCCVEPTFYLEIAIHILARNHKSWIWDWKKYHTDRVKTLKLTDFRWYTLGIRAGRGFDAAMVHEQRHAHQFRATARKAISSFTSNSLPPNCYDTGSEARTAREDLEKSSKTLVKLFLQEWMQTFKNDYPPVTDKVYDNEPIVEAIGPGEIDAVKAERAYVEKMYQEWLKSNPQ
jgi:RHS repeat-associated protein